MKVFRASLPLVLGMLPLLAGCARDDRPRVYPVRGEVFVNGRPAANARVQLHAVDNPAQRDVYPHALVGEDGSFQLTSFRTADGAPAGTYAVTLTWPSPPKPGLDEEGPDWFGGRYADPRRPVKQVTIQPGPNDLGRIDLK